MTFKNKMKNIVQKAKAKKDVKRDIGDVLNDPSFLTVKNGRMRDTVEFVVKVINSRAVRRTTQTARQVLDITEKIRTGNPVSVTAAALASLETVATFFDIEKPDPLDEFVDSLQLRETSRGRLIELITSPEVFEHLNKAIVFSDEKVTIQRIELGTNNFIYARTYDEGEGELPQFFTKYYTDNTFSLPVAYEYIWGFFNGKAFLVRENGMDRSSREYCSLRMRTLNLDSQDLLLDEQEIARVGEEVMKSRSKGRSRSYLLVGPPGTGKSSFCYKAAERFCPKILRLDPSVMDGMSVGELEEFVSGIKPDALIFDDVDRIDSEGYLLFLLENLKRTYPEIVIFASANYYDRLGHAIRRPGRFDRVIWVENPDRTKREEFVRYFANKLNLDFDAELLAYTVKHTNGLSQAYLSEMLYRATNDADLKTSVMGSIKEFKRTLELDDELIEDDEEYEDDEYVDDDDDTDEAPADDDADD